MSVRVRGLTIGIPGRPPVLDGIDLDIGPGEVVAVTGASGSGKSTLALALLGSVRPGLTRMSGSVDVDGHDPFTPAGRRAVRTRIARHVGQDPASALHPARRLSAQLTEAVRRAGTARGDVGAEIGRLCAAVALDAGPLRRRPGGVSGGQAQRAALALALAGRPRLLVLDEPTTGLDGVLAAEVVGLLGALLAASGAAALVATHDRVLRDRIADRVIDLGPAAPVRIRPRPPVRRTPAVRPRLEVAGLSAHHGRSPVLTDVSFTLGVGEAVALVGPSGAGKSTLAACLVGLHVPGSGRLLLDGQPLATGVGGRDPAQRRAVALVAQDAVAALNPRESVRTALLRPLTGVRRLSRAAADMEVAALLDRVALPADIAGRRPGEMSGGQRQRVNLARALAAGPSVLVCDEITAALDPDTAEAVLGLLDELRGDGGLAVVLITHDVAGITGRADRVIVLAGGRVVEHGPTGALLAEPVHPITRGLVEAAGLVPRPA